MRDRGFLDERYLPLQIMRVPMVAEGGEDAFPREKLYEDREWTERLAKRIIGKFRLFDYRYPDCRIVFELLDDRWHRHLIPGSSWDVEVIYFGSERFYRTAENQWLENTLGTPFDYFVDPTHYPDLCLELELRDTPEDASLRALEDRLMGIVRTAGVYTSTAYRERNMLGVLLDFQTEPYERERLERLLVDLGRMPLSGLIRSVRLR
jgi:hypothetical protein